MFQTERLLFMDRIAMAMNTHFIFCTYTNLHQCTHFAAIYDIREVND